MAGSSCVPFLVPHEVPMTPSEFMQQYPRLNFVLDNGAVVNADVHQYMINHADNDRAKDAQAMWHKISAKLNDEVAAKRRAAAEWQKAGNAGPPAPASREWLISRIDPSVTASQ